MSHPPYAHVKNLWYPLDRRPVGSQSPCGCSNKD